jgi:hypothetical protein
VGERANLPLPLDTEKQRPDRDRNHAAGAGRRGGAGKPRRREIVVPLFDNKIVDEKTEGE